MPFDIDQPKPSGAPGSGLQQMLRLMEQEIARLKDELEVIRAGDHPQRRTLILDRVGRIDERQAALDGMRASATGLDRP